MRPFTTALSIALLCAGCAKKDEEVQAFNAGPPSVASLKAKEPAPERTPDASAAADATGPASEPMLDPASPRVPAGPPMLAYSYRYGMTLPSKRIQDVMARHEAACAQAGYQRCQVVSSSINRQTEDFVRATLVLRAAPIWLTPFRTRLAGDAESAGGRLTESAVDSEDLSRDIVDTEAQLRAKTTLRDRLQALLASRPGKVADLLSVERELARVQGEIDSTQSQLAVMRTRVATSEITLQYASPDASPVVGGWSPLARSFRDFTDIVAQSLAGLVRLIAWISPWAVIGSALLWVFRKRLPRPFRRRMKDGTVPPA